MNSFNNQGFRNNQGGRGGKFKRPETPDTHRINHRITARDVRVITDAGEQLGVMTTREALMKAEAAGLDLVEVAPQSKPPVCKIMDYGKFKYREQKKEAEAKKKRTEQVLKELRIRYSTDTGDLNTKLKQAREFILEGNKVKFSMRFKGREAMYVDLGVEKFKEITEKLSDIAVVDEQSPGAGRQIHIVFAPSKSIPAKSAQSNPANSITGKSGAVKATAGQPMSNKPLQIKQEDVVTEEKTDGKKPAA